MISHDPVASQLLTFPFRELASHENPLPIANFLDLTFRRPNMEAEHSVVPGRPPAKLAAFSFFENLAR